MTQDPVLLTLTEKMMLQERHSSHQSQRSSGVGVRSVGMSSTVNSSSYVMSQSTASRRTALAQSYYEDAKRQLTQALSVDERGERMEALDLYNKALTTLRSGLATLCGERGEDARMRATRAKMERMKEQVKSRMETLLQQETVARRNSAQSSSPAQTSKMASSTTGRASLSSSTTGSRSSMSQSVSNKRGSMVGARADLLFNVDTGIGLFQVDNQDHVMKYEDADALSLFRYCESIPGQPPAFLQCGGFVYPLVPGRSPVLKASDRVYMFPELKGEDGTSVGIVLDSASKEELCELDRLLSLMADFRTDTEEPTESLTKDKEKPVWGTTVAGGIDKGVNWVTEKISQGTEAAGNLISKGATKLRDKIEPNEKPTEIPESVQKGVHITRRASGYVVSVSDFLMTSLAKLTVKVGKGVKDAVAESEMVKGREVNPHAKEAWKVTKSSVNGAAAVFIDLKKGASTLIGSLGKETSKTVEHKYGESAGRVTDDSLHATKNVVVLAHTYWSWKTWGIHFLGRVAEVMKDGEKSKTAEKDAEGTRTS